MKPVDQENNAPANNNDTLDSLCDDWAESLRGLTVPEEEGVEECEDPGSNILRDIEAESEVVGEDLVSANPASYAIYSIDCPVDENSNAGGLDCLSPRVSGVAGVGIFAQDGPKTPSLADWKLSKATRNILKTTGAATGTGLIGEDSDEDMGCGLDGASLSRPRLWEDEREAISPLGYEASTPESPAELDMTQMSSHQFQHRTVNAGAGTKSAAGSNSPRTSSVGGAAEVMTPELPSRRVQVRQSFLFLFFKFFSNVRTTSLLIFSLRPIRWLQLRRLPTSALPSTLANSVTKLLK
jgi:hypothetical protein